MRAIFCMVNLFTSFLDATLYSSLKFTLDILRFISVLVKNYLQYLEHLLGHIMQKCGNSHDNTIHKTVVPQTIVWNGKISFEPTLNTVFYIIMMGDSIKMLELQTFTTRQIWYDATLLFRCTFVQLFFNFTVPLYSINAIPYFLFYLDLFKPFFFF